MKLVLMVLSLFLAHEARAASFDPDFIRSSATVSVVSVSSTAAAQLDGSGRQMSNRFVSVIDNEGAADMRCGFSSAVTASSGGFLVRAGTPYVLKVSSRLALWCIRLSGAAANASLLQGASYD